MRKGGMIDVYVPAGVRVAEPILLQKLPAKTRIQVTLEQGAAISVVTLVEGGATVEQHGRVVKDAVIHWHNVTVGDGVTQSLRSVLRGSGARSSVDWVFRADGVQTQRLSACNVFSARDGGGDIVMKGVAADKAHVACNGMIDIGEGGRGTQAYLTEKVLMLDPTARVDAIPALEIKTNDVKASHSATVERVGAEDLFYFASRGVGEKHARQMLVEGFLTEIVDRIDDAEIRKTVSTLLMKP